MNLRRLADLLPGKSRWCRRLLKFPLFLFRTGSWPLSSWLARHDASISVDFRNVPRNDLAASWMAVGTWDELVIADGKVVSRSLGLTLKAGGIPTIGFATLRYLADRGFRTRQIEEGVEVYRKNLAFRITNSEEIDIAREIFLEGSYSFSLEGSWVVFDIGANVGLASLNFASQPWVSHVYAFEPFEATVDAFLQNLALNPSLAEKLTVHRLGWSDREETVTLQYHRERSGSMRLDGPGAYGGPPSGAGERASIQLHRASSEFYRHLPLSSGQPILMKLDCEGSEYPILRDLEAADLLGKIDALVIEWHYALPDELTTRLARAGFCTQVRPVRESDRQGLIFAWRQNTR